MILETKLTLPQPKAGALLRTALIERIKNNLDKKLILITADAGYGKTTLLAQLVKGLRLPDVFLHLDKGDNDLLTFYSYLIAGLEKLAPGLAVRSSDLLKQGSQISGNYELLMGTLINELVEKRKEELFFVFDDYQYLAEDSRVHQALDYFIDHLPERIHAIIASRAVPALRSLSRWRAKQDLYEFSRNELAFTPDETADLMKKVYQIDFGDKDVRRVAMRTEGWITGIQLIMQSAQKEKKTIEESLRDTAETCQSLFEYFANDILSRESQGIRAFLTNSSILDVLTPQACDGILEINNSGQILKQLGRRHLFVSIIGAEKYKYHQLFREFLNELLKESETSLHRKAADFYKQQGDTEQAIEHYLDARDYAQAADLICDITSDLVAGAKITILGKWLQLIPEDSFTGKPELHIAASAYYIAQACLDEAWAHCDRALHSFKMKDDFRAKAEILKEKARIAGMKNDHHLALKLSRKALAILGRINKRNTVEVRSLKGVILNIMAGAWLELGNCDKAIACILRAKSIGEFDYATESNLALLFTYKNNERRAFEVYRDLMSRMKHDYFYQIGGIYYNAVIFALHRGDVAWAVQTTEQGWALCLPYDDAWSKAHLHYCSGIVHLQKGQWDDACSRFSQAESMASELGLAGLKFAALRDAIRACRYQGDYAGARKYLDRALRATGEKPGRSLANLRIEQSLMESARGGHAKAESTVKKCLNEARRQGWDIIAFLAQLALSQIYSELQKNKQAVSLLRRAVRYSRLNNCGGLLLRELNNSVRLTVLARALKTEKGYLEGLGIRTGIGDQCLQVKCFGGLRVSDQRGQPLRMNWFTKKEKSLFIYLVTHRNLPVKRDVLLSKLWPELSPKGRNDNFKTTVYRMRKTLSQALDGQFRDDEIFVKWQETYQLLPGMQWKVDAEEFDGLIKRAVQTESSWEKVQLFRQALDIFREEYLPEIQDLWAEQAREQYNEQKLGALRSLAGYADQHGEHISCVDACNEYLAIDPLSEEVARLCMKNLKIIGRMDDVVACYQTLKQNLNKELKTAPTKETEVFFNLLVNNPASY